MARLEELRQLYRTYLDEYARLSQKRKAGDRLFGMPAAPEREQCHTRFAETMRDWLARQTDTAEAQELLSYIYFAPQTEETDRETYWMLLAIHGMTLTLIEQLSPAEASALREQYNKTYPRFDRLPAQKKVASALKKQANHK